MLALTFIASVPIGYFIVFLPLEREMRDETALMICNAVIGCYVIGSWILIWLGQIKWTGLRVGLTVASVFLAAVPAMIVFGVIILVEDHLDEPAIIFSGMTWGVVWLGSTAFIWRETARERAGRLESLGIQAIACPRCAYNMTGLKQSICPECGTVFTLDQLFAALSGHDSEL